MKNLLREVLYVGLSLICGAIIGMVMVLGLPQHINDSIHDWHTKRGPDASEYLEGMRERSDLLSQAANRNASLLNLIQQDPSLIYNPLTYAAWRENLVIIELAGTYWRGEIAASDYEQFHLSAIHTADVCGDLMQLTMDAIWPPEGYRPPPRTWLEARMIALAGSCFDGIDAILAVLDPDNTSDS